MLNLFNSIQNVWFWEFEKQFILWLQSLGGEGSIIYYLMNFFTLFGEESQIPHYIIQFKSRHANQEIARLAGETNRIDRKTKR